MSISKQQIDDAIALLCMRFPKCFVLFERKRVPLKIAIHIDIIAVLGEQIDRKLLGQALKYYTSNIHYRRAQQAGSPRLDLNGLPAGVVSDADARTAAKDVAAIKAILAQQKQEKLRKPQAEPEINPAPSPQPPERDGLSALRAAAQRRKAIA